jgi:4-oxalocrotonate tautomerase
MPLFRISLNKSSSEDYAAGVGESVQRAIIDAIGIPEADRFQIITEHGEAQFADRLPPHLQG